MLWKNILFNNKSVAESTNNKTQEGGEMWSHVGAYSAWGSRHELRDPQAHDAVDTGAGVGLGFQAARRRRE